MLSFIKVIFCLSLLAISPFIEVPLVAFDIPASEFFVYTYSTQFLLAYFLSSIFKVNYAFLAVAIYLLAGLSGLELFSYGSGLGYVFSAYFPYLIAMLLLSALTFQLKYYYETSYKELAINKVLIAIAPFVAAHLFAIILMTIFGKFSLENIFSMTLTQIFYDMLFGSILFFMCPRI